MPRRAPGPLLLLPPRQVELLVLRLVVVFGGMQVPEVLQARKVDAGRVDTTALVAAMEAELDASGRRALARRVGEAEQGVTAGQKRTEAASAEVASRAASQRAAKAAAVEAAARAAAAAAALAQSLAARALGIEELRRLLAYGEEWLAAAQAARERLERARHGAETVLTERRRRLVEHRATGQPALPEAEVGPAVAAREAEAEALEGERRAVAQRLALDEAKRGEAGDLRPQVDAQAETARLWGELSALIGSADGKKFRTFAQSLTLDVLLAHANGHLAGLAPRYRLQRVPGSDLDLQVVDQDMGDEVRSVNSLSGGEGFLVSLALALGLSSLSARDIRVDSLFVDEGFGTLDPDTLDVAMATLDALQAAGRKVGIISHVPGLAERIGARVEVTPLGSGRSRVAVIGG